MTQKKSFEKLLIEKFAQLLGTTTETLLRHCGMSFSSFDFSYETLEGDALQEVILKITRDLDKGIFSVSGNNRKNDWEKGWNENLQAFKASNFDRRALRPKYLMKNPIKRLFRRFVIPKDPHFEVNFYTVYRIFLFKNFLAGYDHIFEFGCGTGQNLLLLGDIFPDKKLYGLDWAQSAVDLVNAIGKTDNPNLKGIHFDFFHPDYSLKVPTNSAFITFNSLEQIGGNHEPFIKFVLEKKPAMCINSEPLVELYDDNNLLDYLAKKYHKARNYLEGYIPTLKTLEEEGKIEIRSLRRIEFGSLYHEGYSLAVWSIPSKANLV